MSNYLGNLPTETLVLLKNTVVSAGILIAGMIIVWAAIAILSRVARSSSNSLDERIIAPLQRPLIFLLPIIVLKITSSYLTWPGAWQATIGHIITIFLITAAANLAIRIIFIIRDLVIGRHDITAANNLHARKIATQVHIFSRIIVTIIIIIAMAAVFMSFSSMRQVGVSLLASAGITGLILGLAAQKTLATIFAGIQIAITQPIRVDDVVIVENEWGWIEEITLTYVVVRVWDLRRLVLPITYFIEKPFQNWTRTSADILGTVFLYLDYTVPVDALREEMKAFVSKSEHWDKKVCNVQVTDSKPDVMEVRLLISSSNSPAAWNLRVGLREHMINFIQREYPQCLPRVRAEIKNLEA